MWLIQNHTATGTRALISELCLQIQEHENENSELFPSAMANPLNAFGNSILSLFELMGQMDGALWADTSQAELARVVRNLCWLNCKVCQTTETGQESYLGIGYDY